MQVKRTIEDAPESLAKKPRYDEQAASQRFRQHLAMRFDAPKINSIVSNIDRYVERLGRALPETVCAQLMMFVSR